MSVALISIEVSRAVGLELLSLVFQDFFQIDPAPLSSSVYEVRMTREPFSLRAFTDSCDETGVVLTVAVKLNTELSLKEFVEKIQQLRSTFSANEKGWVQITLLAFNQMIKFDPQFPLPYPELHRSARYLIPAIDVWPNFYHAIVGHTLSEIAYRGDYSVDFFCQSKALLDFLKSKQYDNTGNEREKQMKGMKGKI